MEGDKDQCRVDHLSAYGGPNRPNFGGCNPPIIVPYGTIIDLVQFHKRIQETEFRMEGRESRGSRPV